MQIVKLYDGNVPRSGTSVFEFKGIKLSHRSLKKDKIDMVVDINSKIIISTYPPKTDRSVVLDDLAKNIDKLEAFIANPEGYQMVEMPKHTNKVVKEASTHSISMETYSDGTPVVPRAKDKLKKFNMKDVRWTN